MAGTILKRSQAVSASFPAQLSPVCSNILFNSLIEKNKPPCKSIPSPPFLFINRNLRLLQLYLRNKLPKMYII
jgi:hypothetical protein